MGLRRRFDDIKICDCKVQFFEREWQWLCEFLQCDRTGKFISCWRAGGRTNGQKNL